MLNRFLVFSCLLDVTDSFISHCRGHNKCLKLPMCRSITKVLFFIKCVELDVNLENNFTLATTTLSICSCTNRRTEFSWRCEQVLSSSCIHCSWFVIRQNILTSIKITSAVQLHETLDYHGYALFGATFASKTVRMQVPQHCCLTTTASRQGVPSVDCGLSRDAAVPK